MKLVVTLDSGARAGAEHAFQDKALVRLGRAPDNDVVLDGADDRGVSLHHAEIRVADGVVLAEDKGSTNGTLVNGAPITRLRLEPGDRVQLGPSGPLLRIGFELAAPAPQAAAPMPDGGKRYGERTVGLMIQQALAAAGILKPAAAGKSTAYIEALVEKKVRTTSSRLKRIILLAAAVLAVVGAAFGYYVYRNRNVQVIQTTQINYGDAAGTAIASANRYAVFMLAGRAAPDEALTGFCTAFALTANVLATNAHCVLGAKKRFRELFVVMNGSASNRYQVLKMAAHPGYQEGAISPDVGLLLVAGPLPRTVVVAPQAELAAVTPGAPVFLYGFPGRLNREDAPEATFIKGDIGRVTTFDQRLGDFGENTLLQHSAYCTGGTSGSPMFNSDGRVIGINAGGYVEDGKALVGYNFGMRIDLVNALLPLLGRS